MKEIKAYIKPHKLSEVTLALHQVEGLSGMSVSEGRGFGRGKAKDSSHSFQDNLVDYLPHVRIEIICPDDLAETVVSTIEKNAHTGLRGDGKVYISDAQAGIRISTGERSEEEI